MIQTGSLNPVCVKTVLAFVPVGEDILKEIISHRKITSHLNSSVFPREAVTTKLLKEATNLGSPQYPLS